MKENILGKTRNYHDEVVSLYKEKALKRYEEEFDISKRSTGDKKEGRDTYKQFLDTIAKNYPNTHGPYEFTIGGQTFVETGENTGKYQVLGRAGLGMFTMEAIFQQTAGDYATKKYWNRINKILNP